MMPWLRNVLFAASGLCLAGPAIAGAFAVIDGETVKYAGTDYALYAINAPAPGETCVVRGRTHDCGKIARAQLLDLTAGATVVCAAVDDGPDGLPQARCLSNGYDLSHGMVHTGWAIATDETFAALETEARAVGRGMWYRDPVDGEVRMSR